ncbi:MAG: hypothetical protein ABI873_07670 [Marmoricola sp.]
MLSMLILLLVTLVVAGLVVLYVAYPHRGQEMPVVPVLGEAMRSAADAIPTLDGDQVRTATQRR